MLTIILIVVGIVLAAAGFLWRKSAVQKLKAQGDAPENGKKKKKGVMLPTILMVAGIWLFAVKLLELIFGAKPREDFVVDIWAERVNIAGVSISATVITTWIIMAVLILIALAIRIFVIPKMKDHPTGVQNVLEIGIEAICKYTKSGASDTGDGLASYLFALVLFMVGCACAELFGLRTPTSDITMTFSLAFITFILINVYGFKIKGVGGRLRRYKNPMNLVSDLAVPVSMACRLFGNMLGGLIVMELLYYAMGNYAIAVPSVIGLYFSVFHPLIQAFIFVTLTITFIGEATE